MKTLSFPSIGAAMTRSHEIAIGQGAGGENDVTQYWFDVEPGPNDTGLMMVAPDGEVLLTTEEQEALVPVEE